MRMQLCAQRTRIKIRVITVQRPHPSTNQQTKGNRGMDGRVRVQTKNVIYF